MKKIKNISQHYEAKASAWMQLNGLFLLRISLGIVFFWFGFLKYFPGVSPAQDLAIDTISIITFGIMTPKAIIISLATWEVIIGLGFITGRFLKATLILLFAQMIGTFAPVFLFPNLVFSAIPFAPTLEGQYIIKNIVFISAGFVIGSRVFRKKVEAKNIWSLEGSNNNNVA